MSGSEPELEALLEWLDDRIAVASDAGSRLMFIHIRGRLAQLELREGQLRDLRSAIAPIDDGHEVRRWVIDAEEVAAVLRSIDETL